MRRDLGRTARRKAVGRKDPGNDSCRGKQREKEAMSFYVIPSFFCVTVFFIFLCTGIFFFNRVKKSQASFLFTNLVLSIFIVSLSVDVVRAFV